MDLSRHDESNQVAGMRGYHGPAAVVGAVAEIRKGKYNEKCQRGADRSKCVCGYAIEPKGPCFLAVSGCAKDEASRRTNEEYFKAKRQSDIPT